MDMSSKSLQGDDNETALRGELSSLQDANAEMMQTMEIKDAAERYGGEGDEEKAGEAEGVSPGANQVPAGLEASKSVSFQNTKDGGFTDPQNRTVMTLDQIGGNEGGVEGSLTEQPPSPEPVKLKNRLPVQSDLQVEVQDADGGGQRSGPMIGMNGVDTAVEIYAAN